MKISEFITNTREYILQVGVIFTPEWIMERPELSIGAKLCYSYLLRYFTEKGECCPGQKMITTRLGSSEKDIRKYIRELEKYSLIETVREDHGKTDRYLFLDHEWIFEEQAQD